MSRRDFAAKPRPIEAACRPATRCRELRCDLGLMIPEAAARAGLTAAQWHAAEDALDVVLAIACLRRVEEWHAELAATREALLAELAEAA